MFDFIDKNIISLRSKFRQVILKSNNIYLTDMYLTTDKKKEIFNQYGESEMNTGSAEGQIALFSYRISHLTEHLKKNKKDYNTQRALVKLVGKRRRLLDYLKGKDIERYRQIIKALKLRK